MSNTKLENRNSKLGQTGTTQISRVKDFTDLDVWKLARELRKCVYALAQKFPPHEQRSLALQLRRAAISITANIAEGFGRFSYRENAQYCRQARGSAYELRDHLTTALDSGYVSEKEWSDDDALTQRVTRVLNGHIRSTKARQNREDDSKA